MAKEIKVNYKGLKAEYVGNELKGTLEVVNEETGEITTSDVINVTAEVKELLGSLAKEDKLTVSVKKFKEPNTKEREPIYKYTCACGREIKSKCEELHIHCNDCDQDLSLSDK